MASDFVAPCVSFAIHNQFHLQSNGMFDVQHVEHSTNGRNIQHDKYMLIIIIRSIIKHHEITHFIQSSLSAAGSYRLHAFTKKKILSDFVHSLYSLSLRLSQSVNVAHICRHSLSIHQILQHVLGSQTI